MPAPPDAALGMDDVLGALDAVPDAVLLLDEAWRVVHVNAAGVDQVRTPADRLIGRVVWDVFPQPRDHPTYAAAHEVRHTRQAVVVTVALADHHDLGAVLDVGVRDDSHRLPAFRDRPADDASSGRGLRVLEDLAVRVWVDPHTDGGKTTHAYLRR